MQELLFLCHRIPFPPNKGDKIRSYHLLRCLARHYRVHLGTFVDNAADWACVSEVEQMCDETCFLPLNRWRATLRSLSGVPRGRPLTVPYYRDRRLFRWVDNLLLRRPVEQALIFSSAMAQYVEGQTLRRIVDFVDVDSDKWGQYASTTTWPRRWIYSRESRLLLKYERQVASQADGALFVSAAEASLFRTLASNAAERVHHFNNGVDAEFHSPSRGYANPYPPAEKPIVFTGAMDYWPNADAVAWFAQHVFPAVRREFPAATFTVVGSNPVPTVGQLASIKGVRVTGTVPDTRPYLFHAALAVAPLRIARGVQNKVLEAMAMARPIVVSPAALQGIEAIPGRELVVAADAGEFISAVSSLLRQPNHEMGIAARARVISAYNWDRNLEYVLALLQLGPTEVRRRLPAAVSGVRSSVLPAENHT